MLLVLLDFLTTDCGQGVESTLIVCEYIFSWPSLSLSNHHRDMDHHPTIQSPGPTTQDHQPGAGQARPLREHRVPDSLR